MVYPVTAQIDVLNDQLSLFMLGCVIRQATESGHRGFRGVRVDMTISHRLRAR